MVLTRQQLLLDLYVAYYAARRGKTARCYVCRWESDLKENMEQLCDDLITRRYKPMPSKCFIVDYPKKREIFAAMFRDRIVHHLYFNYTQDIYQRTFIQDTYSCIKGRGTHYGIGRITDFCRKESRNWQRPCYVMSLDIRGYFMHIIREKLLGIALSSLCKMASHRISKGSAKTWSDVRDMDFICWLTREIVMLDPKEECIIVGEPEGWVGLDPAKSLRFTEDGRGLPIGNLTSQLLSNVYMNVFDQFVKRKLKCKYYGRYVDDADIVSSDKEWLLSLVPHIRKFLHEELGLELHMGKLQISEVHHGVEFLGAYIKPYRTYFSRHSLERMERKIQLLDFRKPWRVIRSVNSYLGILRHTSSYSLRRRLFLKKEFLNIGIFNDTMTKITDRYLFYNILKTNDYDKQTIRNQERLRSYSRRRKSNHRQLRLEKVEQDQL